MARIREHGEQIALLHGERAERAALGERYSSILANVYAVIRRQKSLGFFTNFFGQFSVIFPFLLLAPAYFFGKATLGALMQTYSTFNNVQDGLTWFIDAYPNLAAYRAIVQAPHRVRGHLEADHRRRPPRLRISPPLPSHGDAFAAEGLVVSLPGTHQPLSAAPHLLVRPGERVLLSGRSGSGKTTLMRALLGDLALRRRGGSKSPRARGSWSCRSGPTCRKALCGQRAGLSAHARRLSRCGRAGRAQRGRARNTRGRNRHGGELAAAAVGRRAAASSVSRGRSWPGPNGCSSTKPPRPSTTLRNPASTRC